MAQEKNTPKTDVTSPLPQDVKASEAAGAQKSPRTTKKTAATTKTAANGAKKASSTAAKSADSAKTAKATTTKSTSGTKTTKSTTAKSTSGTKTAKSTAAKSTSGTKTTKSTAVKSTSGTKTTKSTTKSTSGTKTTTKSAGGKKTVKSTALVAGNAPEEETLRGKKTDAKEQASKGEQNARESTLPAPTPGSEVTPSTVPIHFPTEQRKKRAGMVATVLALLVLFGVAVLIFFFRPTAYTELTHSVAFLYEADRNVTVIAVDGKVRGEAEGQLQEKSYADTGRVCAARIADKLYLIKGRNVTEISGSVLDFALSTDGSVLAYRTAEHKLYYMKIGKKNGTFLLSGTVTSPDYCLSPDGRQLFYTFERDGVSHVDFYSESGDAPHLSDTAGLSPVAVSNQCKYVYYTDAAGSLYLLFDGNKIPCSDTPVSGSLIFNRDFSELLFYDGKEMKLYVKGERVLIPGLAVGEQLELEANHRVAVREHSYGRQYLMRTLLKNYYLHHRGTGKMLVFLKRDGTMQDVSYVDGAETVTVTDKSVFFLLTDVSASTSKTHLYRCKTGKTEYERLSYNVGAFCPNSDGSRVLYTDTHGALYALRVDKEAPVRLCDSIRPETLCATADDAFYFFNSEGKLSVSDNGGECRVPELSATMVWTEGYTAYYAEDAGDGTYRIYANYRNQRRWQLLAERVRF